MKKESNFECSIPLSSEGGSNLGRLLMRVYNLSRMWDPSGDINAPFAFAKFPWEQLISWTNRNTIIPGSQQPNQNVLKSEMVIVHRNQLEMLSCLPWAMKLVWRHWEKNKWSDGLLWDIYIYLILFYFISVFHTQWKVWFFCCNNIVMVLKTACLWLLNLVSGGRQTKNINIFHYKAYHEQSLDY